jgi:hypothetical protein
MALQDKGGAGGTGHVFPGLSNAPKLAALDNRGRTRPTNFDKSEATKVRCGTAGPQAFCLASCKSSTAEKIGFNRGMYLLRALKRRRPLVANIALHSRYPRIWRGFDLPLYAIRVCALRRPKYRLPCTKPIFLGGEFFGVETATGSRKNPS